MEKQGKKRKIDQDIGSLINYLRLKKNWSIEELAYQTGLHENTVSGIIAGNDFYVSSLENIVRALNLSMPDFWKMVQNRTNNSKTIQADMKSTVVSELSDDGKMTITIIFDKYNFKK